MIYYQLIVYHGLLSEEVTNIKIPIKSERINVKRFLDDLFDILNDKDFDVENNFFLIRSSNKKDIRFTTNYTLSDLDYDAADIVERLKELSISNYSETLIDRDDSNPPLLFVFGIRINNRLIYVKIKNKEKREGTRYVLCVSFHYAEEEMQFPYR